VLLVVTYSRRARETLRNACRSHEETVVRRFGRAALLACRLRERHGGDVQVERTEPFNEFADAPESVREAAAAYERRESPSTPYDRFAAGTDHPDSSEMRDREL
jgi:cytochrome c peroxidase